MARFAEEKDLIRVNELRKQVNDVHVNGRPDIFRPGFCQEMRAFLYAMFFSETHKIIVAEREGIICGMVCVEYTTKPESPYNLERHFCHIVEIAVDKDFHRHGVGTELLEFVKQDAKERGLSKIDLDVWEFNESAKEFYDAMGFRPYRTYLELDF